MKRFALFAAAVVALLIIVVPASDGDTGTDMLLDMGNGQTTWLKAGDGSYLEAASASFDLSRIGYEVSGGWFSSVNGMGNHKVGSQECTWRLYLWNGEAWDPSESYSEKVAGVFAVAFYPDPSIAPVEYPGEPTAWTMFRGDSGSTGRSDSYGTDSPVTPIEWYRTYSTGFVDSSIIAAGQYLYHTTGGVYGGSGTNAMPWVYCIDRHTGEEVWSYVFRIGQGYEVTSPLVVGDMLVVTATNWDVYLFNRYTGDVLDTLVLEPGFQYDDEGDTLWDGRTFFTGGTTPVYDSGAIYFGIADGRIVSYGIETTVEEGVRSSKFVQLWEYTPDSAVVGDDYVGPRGCFYYHAPMVGEVDGRRMLFIGSYEGYVYALDSSTGEEVWVKRVVDLRQSNSMEPGTPGSASGISLTSDGRLIVTCTDGAMSPEYGTVQCIDASTGMGPDGSEYYWKHVFMVGSPVLAEDGFYCYGSPSYSGAKELVSADGSTIQAVTGIYKFDYDGRVVWVNPVNHTIKAAMTYADGLLYTNDYSIGKYYPNGGGVAAYSAEDGHQVWKLRLEPYSDTSYAMVAATVIEGKVYVGNDYGAIYCISEVEGKAWGDGGEIEIDSPGFRHWSWIALIVLVLLAFAMLYRFY